MSTDSFIDDMVKELREEKTRKDMADEMCRIVGISPYHGVRFLAIEKLASKRYFRAFDMARVAWAIKFTSEGKT